MEFVNFGEWLQPQPAQRAKVFDPKNWHKENLINSQILLFYYSRCHVHASVILVEIFKCANIDRHFYWHSDALVLWSEYKSRHTLLSWLVCECDRPSDIEIPFNGSNSHPRRTWPWWPLKFGKNTIKHIFACAFRPSKCKVHTPKHSGLNQCPKVEKNSRMFQFFSEFLEPLDLLGPLIRPFWTVCSRYSTHCAMQPLKKELVAV